MIKALLFDDEAAAANVLQLMIERYIPEITDLRIATQVSEARSLVENFKPDILFQDVVMPEINGFEFLSELRHIDFDIIFTTAYDEYAIRAIRFSALDYLLKPINPAELKNAVDRYLHKNKVRKESDVLLKNLLQNLEQKNETAFKLAVPTVSGSMFFSPAEIIRLEGEGNYTRFHLADKKNFLSAKTMKEYEDILLKNGFVRIHKSHLVNISCIENYLHEGSVVLGDKTVLPISRQRKQEVIAVLTSK